MLKNCVQRALEEEERASKSATGDKNRSRRGVS
jgi:hypothetical protein